jgi:conjugal transfer pilus assembly protein TraW
MSWGRYRQILMLLPACLVTGASLAAPPQTIGKTYPIIEPDALAEIEARVQRSSWNGAALFGDPASWSATKSALLVPALKNRTRHVAPTYTLTLDIPDARQGQEGKILYPKGYQFNPLDYVKMPGRLIVVPDSLIAWGRGQLRPGDMLLLTGGNIVQQINAYRDAIYLLEPKIKERFQLSHAPVIVSQDGNRLRLDEISARAAMIQQSRSQLSQKSPSAPKVQP